MPMHLAWNIRKPRGERTVRDFLYRPGHMLTIFIQPKAVLHHLKTVTIGTAKMATSCSDAVNYATGFNVNTN